MNDTVQAYPFPIAVVAETPRASAIVVMQTPFHTTQQLHRETPTGVRRGSVRERIAHLIAQLEPKTLVHVNGTRWRFDATPLTTTSAITVRAACEFLGCTPTRNGVIARIIDAYPEFEPRLRLVAQSRRRDDRVRAAQPLLAAIIVAHAASVAHLMKHG